MTTYGSYLKDIPKPHRLRYPNSDPDDPRYVHIQLLSYMGVAPGATHYYAEIREEHNPVWDSRDAAGWGRPGEENGWAICWDHPREWKGRIFEEQFTSKAVANGWIKDILQEHFNDGNNYKFFSELMADPVDAFISSLKEGD